LLCILKPYDLGCGQILTNLPYADESSSHTALITFKSGLDNSEVSNFFLSVDHFSPLFVHWPVQSVEKESAKNKSKIKMQTKNKISNIKNQNFGGPSGRLP